MYSYFSADLRLKYSYDYAFIIEKSIPLFYQLDRSYTVIHGLCSGAERLAGSTAPSIRPR